MNKTTVSAATIDCSNDDTINHVNKCLALWALSIGYLPFFGFLLKGIIG